MKIIFLTLQNQMVSCNRQNVHVVILMGVDRYGNVVEDKNNLNTSNV